jgi:hypothetical protein
MRQITAKVKVASVTDGAGGSGTKLVSFQPDYQDGRNKEWAAATPHLHLQMTVREDVAQHFVQGQAMTLVFEPAEG